MATDHAYIAHFVAPTFGADGNWREIAHVWRSLADANAYSGEHEIPEIAKDTPRDYTTAHVGWYVNVVTHEVASSPPADTSAAAQRAEIESIIRAGYYAFNRSRFAQADDASTRPIYATVDKRTQFLFAALPVNSTDAALDLIKTEARVALDDFAFSADMSAWAAAFDGGSFYVFTKGATEDSVALPSASAGITAPTTTQVSAVSLAAML